MAIKGGDMFQDFIQRIRQHYLFSNLREGFRLYMSDRITLVSFIGLMLLILLAIVGPSLAPYDPQEIQRAEDGGIKRRAAPSTEHVLGTTEGGLDVASRLLIGTRPTLMIGFAAGTMVVGIGLFIGLTSGYFGGPVDSVLMRITDFAYGIPLVPTAIVVITFFGMGFWSTIALIGFLLWRGNARVFRSQVLQIKEREHVQAAEALGASKPYILLRHILPNMLGMVMLFFALGTGVAILISASLAFLGFMDPFQPSWGVILRNAYSSGFAMNAWWWTLSAGFAIALTVLIIIMLGRGYERVHKDEVTETGGGL